MSARRAHKLKRLQEKLANRHGALVHLHYNRDGGRHTPYLSQLNCWQRLQLRWLQWRLMAIEKELYGEPPDDPWRGLGG